MTGDEQRHPDPPEPAGVLTITWQEALKRIIKPPIRDLAGLLLNRSTLCVDLRKHVGSVDELSHEQSSDDPVVVRFIDLDKRPAAFAALEHEDVIYEVLRMAAVRMEPRGLDVLAAAGLKIDTDFNLADYEQLMANDELGQGLRKRHIDALKQRYNLNLSK